MPDGLITVVCNSGVVVVLRRDPTVEVGENSSKNWGSLGPVVRRSGLPVGDGPHDVAALSNVLAVVEREIGSARP